jgi:hypothetical protein
MKSDAVPSHFSGVFIDRAGVEPPPELANDFIQIVSYVELEVKNKTD